jgi:hypothetical protein
MGKKKAKSASEGSSGEPERGAKTRAIRDYLAANKNAKPKEVVAALKGQGLEVSPNLVSIQRAKMKVRKAKRNVAAASSTSSSGSIDKPRGLEAALTLYKAAKGQDVPGKQVSSAFLSLVEMLS